MLFLQDTADPPEFGAGGKGSILLNHYLLSGILEPANSDVCLGPYVLGC